MAKREGPLDEGQWLEAVADAGHPGPTAAEAEGHVGAEAGGTVDVVDAGPAQHGGRIGRATAEATAGRDALDHVDRSRPPDQRRAPSGTRLSGPVDSPVRSGAGEGECRHRR